jgi:hypothetical protein
MGIERQRKDLDNLPIFSLVLILAHKEVAQPTLQKYPESVSMSRVDGCFMQSFKHLNPHAKTFLCSRRHRVKQPT